MNKKLLVATFLSVLTSLSAAIVAEAADAPSAGGSGGSSAQAPAGGNNNSSNSNNNNDKKASKGYGKPMVLKDILSDDGKNMLITCEDKPFDTVNGRMPVSQFRNIGQCTSAVKNLQLGQFIGNGAETIPMFVKKLGGSFGSSVDIDVKMPEGINGYAGMRSKIMDLSGNLSTNFAGSGPLLSKDGKSGKFMQDDLSIYNGDGGGASSGSGEKSKEKTVVTSSGEKRKVFSTKYAGDKEVIEQGACQMIEMPSRQAMTPESMKQQPGGRFKIVQLMNGGNKISEITGDTIEGETKKINQENSTFSETDERPSNTAERGEELVADVEQIRNREHPFAPRNDSDWQDRTAPGTGSSSGGGGGGSSGGGGGFVKNLTGSNAIAYLMSGISSASTFEIANMSGNSTGGYSSSGSSSSSSNSTYTYVCGKKEFQTMGNKKAWEKMGEQTIESDVEDSDASVTLPPNDFGYYKQPVENGGKILVTTTRNAISWVYYEVCYAVLSNYMTEQQATDICQYSMCRAIDLTPVWPENHLKMGYNNSPDYDDQESCGGQNNSNNTNANNNAGGNGFNSGGAGAGQSGQTGQNGQNQQSSGSKHKVDCSLPYIYTASRKGDSDGEGLSWYHAEPKENFGYNGPPLIHWPSGQPAPKDVIEKTGGDKEKWQFWRTVIASGNKYYAADESNQSEEGVQNMSAPFGGWKELVLYTTRGANWEGVNCLPVYEKNFYQGSSVGYALWRTSPSFNFDNFVKKREKTIQTQAPSGYKDVKRNPYNVVVEDKTAMSFMNRSLPVQMGKYKFEGFIGAQMGGSGGSNSSGNNAGNNSGNNNSSGNSGSEDTWPGTVPGQGNLKGLASATRGSVIIFDGSKGTKAQGAKYRPSFAGYVEEVMEDGCLRVSMSDNGGIRDAYGLTENYGVVTERLMCPPSGSANVAAAKKLGKQQVAFTTTPGVMGVLSSGVGLNMNASGAAQQVVNKLMGMFKISGFPTAGGGNYPSCSYINVRQCTEEDWDSFKIYNPRGTPSEDPNTGEITYSNPDMRQFDPITGALKSTGASSGAGATGAATGALNGIASGVANGVTGAATGIVNGVTGAATGAVNGVVNGVTGAVNGVTSTATGAVNGVVSGANGIVNGASGLVNGGASSSVQSGLGTNGSNFIQGVVNGNGSDALKNAVTTTTP